MLLASNLTPPGRRLRVPLFLIALLFGIPVLGGHQHGLAGEPGPIVSPDDSYFAFVPATQNLPIDADCFLRAETALVFPHLSSLLQAPITLAPSESSASVSLTNAHLDPTVSALVQVGAFRFGPEYGELSLTYRFMASQGKELLQESSLPGLAQVTSRLNLNSLDLDYLHRDCPVGWNTLLTWYVGARVQVVYFDTGAQTTTLQQTANNDFYGAGPHAGLTLSHPLPLELLDGAVGHPAISLFGRFDSAVVVGYNTTQNFTEFGTAANGEAVFAGFTPGSAGPGVAFNQQAVTVSPSFAVQVGLSGMLPLCPGLGFRGGYQFEQWYQLGAVGASHGSLNASGMFLGCTWLY